MLHHLLVAFVALGAAFCYAASNVIEQRKAATAPPETSMRIGLLWYLAHQPIWWLGIIVDVGGFALQALALGLGQLLFVQPLLVTSLLFSLVLGAMTGSHRLSIPDLGWAVLLVSGLSIFLVVAAPSGGFDERPFTDWVVPFLLLLLVVAACVTLSEHGARAQRAMLLGAAAGATFGVSSTLMKTFSHRLGDGGVPALLSTWEPYAMGLVIALGFLLMQSAFQASDLRAALPAVEAGEPIVACLLGLTLMHESLHAHGLLSHVVILLAVGAMAVSVIELARSAAVAREAPPPLFVDDPRFDAAVRAPEAGEGEPTGADDRPVSFGVCGRRPRVARR